MSPTLRTHWLPFNRQQMMDTSRLGWPALPMAARQTYCSHLPDVSLFRNFILADRNCSGDDRTSTQVTSVSGQVKVLFSHLRPRSLKGDLPYSLGLRERKVWSVLLGLPEQHREDAGD